MNPWRARPLSMLLATGLGTGLSPLIPGTVGSAALTAAWLHLPTITPSQHLLLFLLLTLVAYLSTRRVLEKMPHQHDPSCIVIDEWAGMWLSLTFVPKDAAFALVAFSLFRLFDILKPWIVGSAEKLPGSLGVTADDIVAGGFACLVMIVAQRLA